MDQADNLEPRFVTEDSALAQFLAYRAHRAECRIAASGSNRIEFVFADNDRLRADGIAFFTGVNVPAQKFAEAGRVLRRLINQARARHAAMAQRRADDERTPASALLMVGHRE